MLRFEVCQYVLGKKYRKKVNFSFSVRSKENTESTTLPFRWSLDLTFSVCLLNIAMGANKVST